ncbi:hypothetical protein ACEN8K_46590, partial [Variovorax sp. CT11-76]
MHRREFEAAAEQVGQLGLGPQRVVFMGTGPLLYLVAYQYAKAGARVAAVLDTARLADQLAATPAMLR